MHTYIHLSTYIYMKTCIHSRMSSYIHTWRLMYNLYRQTFMLVCLHTCIHTHIHICIKTSIHTDIHAYLATCIHIHRYLFMYGCIYTYKLPANMHAYTHLCLVYMQTYKDSYIHTHTDIYMYIDACQPTY